MFVYELSGCGFDSRCSLLINMPWINSLHKKYPAQYPSHLLKKSLIENFIFCEVLFTSVLERYFVSLRIQSKCGKRRTRKNSVFGHISRSDFLYQMSFCHKFYPGNLKNLSEIVLFKTPMSELKCIMLCL